MSLILEISCRPTSRACHCYASHVRRRSKVRFLLDHVWMSE